jgi:SAM-dependent methyltransferase
MRREFLELACCPACEGALILSEGDWNADEVHSGSLECKQCGRGYRIAKRLPLLYADDETWAPNAREARGWVELHKSLGIYDQTGVEIDFQLPYFPEEPWTSVARHFDAGLELAALTGRETVLDLGAGRGWAAKHLAQHGCRVVAIDIVPDDQVGLGRAWALMERAGVRFEPVIGDFERLPLREASFDLVFCAAVLHHSVDLPRLLRSVLRVLKAGGRLVAVNEPCLGAGENEQEVLERDAAQELSFGIKETRPNLGRYWAAFREARFRDVELVPVDAYGLDDEELERWTRDVLGRFPDEVEMFGLLPPPRSRREALLRSVLTATTHGVIIRASK